MVSFRSVCLRVIAGVVSALGCTVLVGPGALAVERPAATPLPSNCPWSMTLVYDTTLGDGSNTITLPLAQAGSYGMFSGGNPYTRFNIRWGGDGTGVRKIGNFDGWEKEASFTYDRPGTYIVTTCGSLYGYGLDPDTHPKVAASNKKLVSVVRFSEKTANFRWAFAGAENLVSVPARLDRRYEWGCAVADFRAMFQDASRFNGDIGDWQTGCVHYMDGMFKGASSFNQDIGRWDTGRVKGMAGMFDGATSFDQDLNRWDTGNVASMERMFRGASSFNHYLFGWNTTKVATMASMFEAATSFNSDLSGWNTGKVTSMAHMFDGASSFDQPIARWDTRNVTTMAHMFEHASSFDHELVGWDTAKVASMAGMFASATVFTQDLSGFNTAKVTNMDQMFAGDRSEGVDVSGWDVSQLRSAANFSDSSHFWAQGAYDKVLIAWARQAVRRDVTFEAGAACYSTPDGAAAREKLNTEYNWHITDAGRC